VARHPSATRTEDGRVTRPPNDATEAARATAEAVARRSYGKLVAFLAVRSRDVAAAEDALADAFATALEEWPRIGCPANPEAWLLTVSRRKLIDRARHRGIVEGAEPELQRMAEALDTDDDAIPDHRLALMFACAHPAIDVGIRSPLMLQAVLGLDAKRIASAFLMSPAAVGKRLGRAKEKIRQAAIPLRIPARDELGGRLDTVLDAIYAAFSHGWSDPVGIDASRRDLVEEAIFLARVVVALMPDEAEAIGLLACLLHAHARRRARRNADGDYVPLADQDTSAWDGPMIDEAESWLHRAGGMRAIGRYQLEAALQSAHVERRRSGQDTARAILQLHDALANLLASPVAAINRALAVADVHGAAAALDAMPDAGADGRLAGYQPYWAARAELLARVGARRDASTAYDIAIGLESDDAVRRFLQRRQAGLDGDDDPAIAR
jgi:predicted RNA polymerase sigma factor